MQSKLKLTIVSPTYNQAKFIEKTFRSILSQKSQFPLEYIVVDGLSTDETPEIVKRYRPLFKQADITFRYIREKDKGQSDAINKGWKQATGDVLTFLNTDDYYLPQALNRVMKHFSEHPETQWLYGGWRIVNEKGKTFREYRAPQFSHFALATYAMNIGQPSCFYRRSLLKKVGPINTKLHLAMDYDLWLRFSQHAHPAVLSHTLSAMRYHSQAKSSQFAVKHNREAYEVAKKHLPHNALHYQAHLLFRYLAGRVMIALGRSLSQEVV